MLASSVNLIVVGAVLSACSNGPSEDSYQAEDRSSWGSFAVWAGSPKFRNAYDALVAYTQDATALREARSSYASQKSQNDSSELPAGDSPEPIYPETSGSFEFVQILSQSEGTSVFRASDGLCVLLLSPGDSFSAYPGQSVYMTMHNRGETMSLTIGQAAVFRSGPSPVQMRHFDGFSPDRTREHEVREQIERLEELLASRLSGARDKLAGPFYARIDARIEPGLTPTRFLVSDRSGPVFCITDRASSSDCPPGCAEQISLADLGAGLLRSTALTHPVTDESANAASDATSALVVDNSVSPSRASSTEASANSASRGHVLDDVRQVGAPPIQTETKGSDVHDAGILALERNEGSDVAPPKNKPTAGDRGCRNMAGSWDLTTTVTEAKNRGAIGVHGYYEFLIEEDCRIALAKTGFSGPGGRDFAADQVQRGRSVLSETRVGGPWEFSIGLGRGNAVDLTISFALDFANGVTGRWRHTAASYVTSGFEGTVTGQRAPASHLVATPTVQIEPTPFPTRDDIEEKNDRETRAMRDAPNEVIPGRDLGEAEESLRCNAESECPKDYGVAAQFLTRFCDGSFTAHDMERLQYAVSQEQVSRRSLVLLFNAYGAFYGHEFKREKWLNAFFYGTGEWLPESCRRMLRKYRVAAEVPRHLTEVRDSLKMLWRASLPKQAP